MSAFAIHTEPDRAAVAALLADCRLPSADLSDAHMPHFFYAGSRKVPEGVVGIELCGADALLRSLAVREALRGTGLGRRLVAHAEHYVRAQGARTMYLLTTTAEGYFRGCGYADASRAAAPEPIRKTCEFAEICPASSMFMFKPL